ncbi:hypothetical protein ASPTUDRAFT_46671, partial [Aspergillus tubingensis CBS 134.48]
MRGKKIVGKLWVGRDGRGGGGGGGRRKEEEGGGGRGSPSGLPPSGSSTLNSLAVTHQPSLAHHTMPGTV